MDTMKEFRDQSVEERKAMLHDPSKNIFEMKNEISTTRKIDKPNLLRKKKRDRARILTLLNRKGEKV